MSFESINLEHMHEEKQDFRLRYVSISKYEGDWHISSQNFSTS